MNKRQIVLIIQDVRSTHNVGSLLRSADGLGIKHVYMTGYTPYPETKKDDRLPHIRQKIAKQINKTALGAEDSVPWTHIEDITLLKDILKREGFLIAALEQTKKSLPIARLGPTDDIALVVGNEVEGLDDTALNIADLVVQIPMLGSKESFNVANAGSMALYHLRYVA